MHFGSNWYYQFMSKYKLFQSKYQRVLLAVALVIIAMLMAFDSGAEVDDRVGVGIFVAILLVSAAGVVYWMTNAKTDSSDSRTDNIDKYAAIFKTTALIGALTSGLIWVGAIVVKSLDINIGTDLGYGILLAIWFYAGLTVTAISLIATIAITLISKSKNDN